MIKVIFFAKYRELLNTKELELDPKQFTSIKQIIDQLKTRGEHWHKVFCSEKLIIALNQQRTNADSPVKDHDEVAFFPPVTGG